MDRAALRTSITLAITAAAGAGAAAAADVYLRPSKPILGQERLTPGVLVALGGLAVGVFKVGPAALYRHAGALGAGAAAYEAGKVVFEKAAVAEIAKRQAVQASAGWGVSGAPAPAQLGPRRVVTARDLRAALDTINAAKAA